MSRDTVLNFVRNNQSDISGHLLFIYDTIIQNRNNFIDGTIVEFGVRDGNSTFVLMAAATDISGKLISVDISNCDSVRNRLDKQFPVKWAFYQIDDLNFKIGLIDVLFIDTNHEYEHTIKELVTNIPFMSKNGIIIMHDTNIDTRVYPDQKSMVANAINTVFKLNEKTDWKHDFILETEIAKIVNHAHNNGMAYIYLNLKTKL
jgi:cephalosporin hydroxylase